MKEQALRRVEPVEARLAEEAEPFQVYLAGPLFSQGERRFNQELNQLVTGLGFKTYFPQEDAGLIDDLLRQGMDVREARDFIFRRNQEAVQQADIIVFVLDGRAPDEGACIEAAMGFALGKEVIGLKTDFRTCEPGGNNIMVDGILRYRIAEDFSQLEVSLQALRDKLRARPATSRRHPLERTRAYPYIAVAGCIAAGKTTLVGLLGDQPGWSTIEEPVDENPYLSGVYTDLPGLAFRVQAFYLGGRTRQHMRALEIVGPAVQDRCLYEDTEVFAETYHQQGAFDQADLATLREIYRPLADLLPAPDLLVYVHAPLDLLLYRIRSRGRAFEKAIDPDLLEQLHHNYQEWIERQTWAPVLKVDSSLLDFSRDPTAKAEVIHRVQWALEELGAL